MKIAYVLYPDFTALDLVGPYEISAADEILVDWLRAAAPGCQWTASV